MKRNLVHSITISIIITLGTACMPKETDPFALKAQFVVGDVKVESAAGSRVPAPGDTILESDTVKTGPYSQIDMVYGERGFLRLQENSLLRVSELREKQGGGTGLSLDQGKIFVVVSKLAKGTSFSVKTPLTLAAVRGTSFRVSADAKTARIDVVAGKVTVNPVREGKVVEEVSAVVENSQAVELTPEKVAAVFEKKEAIPVQEISADVMTQIKNEVREVPAEVIKKLEPESVRELKQVVQPPSQDVALQKIKEA
ncbi:MAG: FecR domain-containing protein, partial [Spirochaetes bacterium]|nr:FecR domain-containing protein [Spirochaetota bacterium]